MTGSGAGFSKLAKAGGAASGVWDFLVAWAAQARTLVIMADNLFGLETSRAGSLAETGGGSTKAAAPSSRATAVGPGAPREGGGKASGAFDRLATWAAWAAHPRAWVIRAEKRFGGHASGAGGRLGAGGFSASASSAKPAASLA